MRRIVIVGSSCAGKTTLARAIAERRSIRHVELDAHHWAPDWVERDDAEMRRTVDDATRDGSWVADGNYAVVRDILWPRADTIIWLDYGFPLVFSRAFRRTLRRGVTREPVFSGNVESLRRGFLSTDSILLWVIRTHGARHRRYRAMLAPPAGTPRHETVRPWCEVLRFRTPRETRRWLAGLDASA